MIYSLLYLLFSSLWTPPAPRPKSDSESDNNNDGGKLPPMPSKVQLDAQYTQLMVNPNIFVSYCYCTVILFKQQLTAV